MLQVPSSSKRGWSKDQQRLLLGFVGWSIVNGDNKIPWRLWKSRDGTHHNEQARWEWNRLTRQYNSSDYLEIAKYLKIDEIDVSNALLDPETIDEALSSAEKSKFYYRGNDEADPDEQGDWIWFPNFKPKGGINYRLPIHTIKMLYRLYLAAGKAITIKQICNFASIEPDVLSGIKSRLGLTSESASLLLADLDGLGLDDFANAAAELVEDREWLLKAKMTEEENSFYRREYERLKKIEHLSEINTQRVYEALIEKAPELSAKAKLPKKPTIIIKNKRELIDMLCLADWQVGLQQNDTDVIVAQPCNNAILQTRLDKILDQFYSNRKSANVSKLHIGFLGDHAHGPDQKTGHQTQLNPMDVVGTDQILIVKKMFSKAIEMGAEICPKVEVDAIGGNHDTNYITNFHWIHMIMEFLKDQYEKEGRVDFVSTKATSLPIEINKKMVTILDHGYKIPQPSLEAKASKPTDKLTPVERLVHYFNLPHQLQYVIRGDKHTRGHREHTNCEEIAVGSLVGGDQYSESLWLISRPSQTHLVFDKEEGLVDIHFLYAD